MIEASELQAEHEAGELTEVQGDAYIRAAHLAGKREVTYQVAPGRKMSEALAAALKDAGFIVKVDLNGSAWSISW